MRIIFLGSGSAFTLGANNYQSNIIIESASRRRLLFDCGTDIRFSLSDQGLSYPDIQDVFVSHLHADHVGGLEWYALNTKFDKKIKAKPQLYISQAIAKDLWDHVLSGGLSSLADIEPSLSNFFDIHPIVDSFSWEGAKMELVPTLHCLNGFHPMSTHGLSITYGGKKMWITADTQFTPDRFERLYKESDLIFHDCETSAQPTGVHAHYNQLKTLPPEMKKKMWLYHFNPGSLPDAVADGFCGFVNKGQVFEMS